MPGDVAQRRALAAPLGSGRAGSPSKSRMHPVVAGPQRLAEVEVAVRCGSACPARAVLRERRSWSRSSSPRPAIGASRLVLGQLEEDPLDLLVDGRREQAERLDARRLGREDRDRSGRRRARVCISPVTSPSRRSRSRNRSGSLGERRRARAPSRRAPSGMNSWTMPSVAPSGRPRTRTSRAARRCAGSRAR